MITTTNPYTQTTLKNYSILSNLQLNNTLDNCNKSYLNWKNTPLNLREQLFIELQKILIEKKQIFAELISSEMGKPINESCSEIDKCIDLIKYYLNNFKTFLNPKSISNSVKTHFHPTGTILGIMPWNFPFWQVFRYIIPNILGGNNCLLKHAPNTFGCGTAIENLFKEAGFPNYVFKNLIIDINQTETVIKHKTITGICVTGSEKAGSAIASLAGKYLKPSVLELGGTDASIILQDADFNTAFTASVNARLLNAGQICIAPKRIFIHEDNLEQATTISLKKIKNITIGNPLETNTNMGPISKIEFLPILEKQVKKAIKHGAKIIIGGEPKPPFFEPTLLITTANNPCLQEEIFGPIICLIPYKKESDLSSYVNNSNYGLGAAIWSKNIDKAKKIATQLDVGYVSINQIVKSDPKYPFGGIKNSGYGKELGEEGFKTFLNAKTIVL